MASGSRRRGFISALLSVVAATLCGQAVAANPPNLCSHGGRWAATNVRTPAAVSAYLSTLDNARFDLRAACAHWAGTFSQRHFSAAQTAEDSQIPPPRMIL